MKGSKPDHGVILAGGRSQRFGSDKALATLSGKPLIAHAVELVKSVGLKACVVTESHRDYSFLRCPIYFDRQAYGGPLAGLERAFEIFPDEKILALTCDMPFLKKEDLRGLLDQKHEVYDVVVYRLENDRFQPFPGIYTTSLKNKIYLDSQHGVSMQHFLRTIDKILEINPGSAMKRFSNINTTDNFLKA